MKKTFLWIAVVVALIVGLVVGRMIPSGNSQAAAKPDAKQGAGAGKGGKGGRPVPVHVCAVETKPLSEEINVAASILPDEAAALCTELAGRVAELPMKEGAVVKKGDLICRIAADDIAAQLRKAEAVNNLNKQKTIRTKDLLSKQMASTEDLETAEMTESSSAADVDQLRAQLAKSEILAPFAGLVGLRTVSPGAYVSIGTKITDIVSKGPLKIECSVPERYSELVKPGTHITLTFSQSSKSVDATVYATQPSVDKSTRTLAVRAKLSDATKLVPGTFVSAAIVIRHSDNSVMIPAEAVVPDVAGPKVYAVVNCKAVPHFVKTGIRQDDMVEIISGANEGDSVVTDGAALLRPNAPVVIADDAAKAPASDGSASAVPNGDDQSGGKNQKHAKGSR